jgi:tetratricopeptide (TPR) repeat protein
MDYRRNRNIQKALEYLQNAVELNKRGDYFFERAEIRAELLDYLGAIKDYDLAKKYGFDEAYCWYRKAHMYNRLEKPEIAISCFTKALNRDTTLYDAYNSRGTLLYQQKKYNETLQDFNKAAELFPQSFKVFTNRGLVHVKLHNDAEACDDFYKALQLGYSPAEDFLKEYCGYRK